MSTPFKMNGWPEHDIKADKRVSPGYIPDPKEMDRKRREEAAKKEKKKTTVEKSLEKLKQNIDNLTKKGGKIAEKLLIIKKNKPSPKPESKKIPKKTKPTPVLNPWTPVGPEYDM